MWGGTGGAPCCQTSPSWPGHHQRAGHRPPPPPAPHPLGARRGSWSTRNASPGPSSSWGGSEDETCHCCSHTAPRGPHGHGDTRLPCATHPHPTQEVYRVRSSAEVLPTPGPRAPASPHPTSACSRSLEQGGDAGTHTSSWPPKGEGSQADPRHPSRGAPRRLPACPSALPGPGALCLPAIFGSLLRAPLRLLIMRVRNSFGLSYIRKGRGLEAAKYTGACGSERGGFGSECGKGIV